MAHKLARLVYRILKVGTRVRRQGSGVLRAATPRTTNATAQKTSCQAGSANRRTRRGLTAFIRHGFWRGGTNGLSRALPSATARCRSWLEPRKIETDPSFALCGPSPRLARLCCRERAKKGQRAQDSDRGARNTSRWGDDAVKRVCGCPAFGSPPVHVAV
jgi:hypothetical protein